jgi:hypothetical protein
MTTDLVSVTAWVKPEIKETLRQAAFEARVSVSTYTAAILEAQQSGPDISLDSEAINLLEKMRNATGRKTLSQMAGVAIRRLYEAYVKGGKIRE